MTDLQIVEVDPGDDALVDAWHAALVEGSSWGREDTASPFTLEESRVRLQTPGDGVVMIAYAGVLAGHVVAAALVELPVLDNPRLAELDLTVRPQVRGRGHGSTFLRAVESILAARGRSTVLVLVHWPWTADPRGAGHPGVEFALRHGYALGLVDAQRRLDLPVADALLDRLGEQAAPHHAAYTLEGFVGPVPERLLQGWAEVNAALYTEAPLGELEREPGVADPAAVREGEALLTQQGRTRYATVAVDADGRVAAYTTLVTTAHEPTRAYQWGTLVRGVDRGHRLGVALKAANLRMLQDAQPEVTRITTWNAEVNAPMLAVNEALGFRPVERMGEFQKVAAHRSGG